MDGSCRNGLNTKDTMRFYFLCPVCRNFNLNLNRYLWRYIISRRFKALLEGSCGEIIYSWAQRCPKFSNILQLNQLTTLLLEVSLSLVLLVPSAFDAKTYRVSKNSVDKNGYLMPQKWSDAATSVDGATNHFYRTLYY